MLIIKKPDLIKLLICGFIVSALGVDTARANIGGAIPVDEQVRRAEVIILGRAIRTTSCQVGGVSLKCVEFDGVAVIKTVGSLNVSQNIRVVLDSAVEELSVECCQKGEVYFLLLNEHNGLYYPFFGQDSVRRLASSSEPKADRATYRQFRRIWHTGHGR